MRVMTFNLRFENEMDGPNGWLYRREMVVKLIREYTPSILGTQEGKWSQLLYLRDHLSEYHLHAQGRVLDGVSQYPSLYFFKGHFDVKKGGEFWLSQTPQVHRSKNWDSAYPRMMSYAQVQGESNNRLLWVAVTHLDHVGSEARYQQAKQLANWVRRNPGPVIVMGDFNDHPQSPVHDLLTGDDVGLSDTWQIAGHDEGSDSSTIHGFQGVPQKGRIDWILVTRHFRVMEALIVRDHFGNRYPSDHFPYMVKLEWI